MVESGENFALSVSLLRVVSVVRLHGEHLPLLGLSADERRRAIVRPVARLVQTVPFDLLAQCFPLFLLCLGFDVLEVVPDPVRDGSLFLSLPLLLLQHLIMRSLLSLMLSLISISLEILDESLPIEVIVVAGILNKLVELGRVVIAALVV